MNENLRTLIQGALRRDPSVNFADREQAALDAIYEEYGIDRNTTGKQLIRLGCFDVIEEALTEVIVEQMTNIMGNLAEIKHFARNEEVVFEIKGLGKRRALLSIMPGARAGVYKAHRLDGKKLSMRTHVITAGAFVNLEDILLGRTSLGELMDNILAGIQYQIYKDIVTAMRTVKTLAPAANRKTGAGIVKKDIDDLVRIISAYGTPVIFCFESTAAKFDNLITLDAERHTMSESDINEIAATGRVSAYKGTKLVVLPNYLLDENNENWMFSEADVFILPSDVKPVRVAFQGDGYMETVSHNLGGAEQNYHMMMGTAILAYNNLAVYTDSDVTEAESGKSLI